MMGAIGARLGRGLREYQRSMADSSAAGEPHDFDPDSPTSLFRRVIALSLVTIPVLAGLVLLNLLDDQQPLPVVILSLATLLFVVAVLWWILDRPSPARSRTGAMVELLGVITLLAGISYYEPQGLSTPFWMAVPILVGAMILGTRAASVLAGYAVTVLLATYLVKAWQDPFAPTAFAQVAITLRRVLFLVVVLLIGLAFRRLVDRQIAALHMQRETIGDQAENLAAEVKQRRMAQEELARSLSAVMTGATDGVVTYDEDGRIIDVNEAAARFLGTERSGLAGRQLFETLAAFIGPVTPELRQQLHLPGARVELQLWDGARIRSSEWAVSATEAADRVVTMAIVRDVTERKDLEARLRQQAQVDATTGVAKVPHFMERLDGMRADGAAGVGGVLAVGIDDLRTLHDGHGWEFAQEILRITAQRLVRLLGPDGEVALFDGVGFLVGVPSPARDLGGLARRICGTIAQPVELWGNRVIITASVGIAGPAGAAGATAEEHVRHAGAALNLARGQGHEQILVYDEEFRAEALMRLELDQALHVAAAHSEFQLHYQPIVDLASGAVLGAEALLRWQRPGWGLVLPSLFLSRLEATGLIVGVGDWVLREACRSLAAWQDRFRGAEGAGSLPPTMNVNLSPLQFVQGDLSGSVAEIVREHGLRPEQLVLEITESVAFDPRTGVLDTIHQLRESGVTIAIDDFGTGYSSLSQLLHLPADVLKLDKSFVADVTVPRGRAVVAAVIEIARQLGVPMVAEGVETEEQREQLRAMGCERAQGYLFSRPVPDLPGPEVLRVVG